MRRALILTPLFATMLLAAPAMAEEAVDGDPAPRMNKKEMAEKLAKKVDPVAVPPRQTKGISLPTTDPQGPEEPEAHAAPAEKGTAPEEAKGGDALMHLRKAYD